MSSFRYADRLKFERLFDMDSGYVLWFSNRTFRDFFYSTLDIDIYDGSWADPGLSKANLLRAFWEKGDDAQIYKVNRELLEIWSAQKKDKSETDLALLEECKLLNDKLKGKLPIKNLDALGSFDVDENLDSIIKDIKHNIENNNPELTLDRLHNYLVKYGRKLCDKHSIIIRDTDTLNALFGLYNKWLHDNSMIESKMSIQIIGKVVKLFKEFNSVRNNQSAAHPNPHLNKMESLFIVDTICSIIDFINKIEDIVADSIDKEVDAYDPLPF